ncbi:acetolactate synthase 2 small subunit [Serratia symbiotica]|uniref:Acetolactate synthase 2 small subunit n=1 Tax=Serratia symbiotica TaxID=138074 RepID=A0A068Z5N5_9GAMM|nr:acetolactate synthase 2 small subunit [Serratia symbiotica]MBF1996078.1 acetolactate synthase 2 small subunit [Serratia symbiotica]MBQ0955046.1 acetolactate synthase 2 small subunit [Serratia symbiotica]MCX2958000.1 acetolactate synthase 2 small subunit [Serratia symbiotica]NIG88444.1 acetolactate synthase 2 small subunit [Serratia symbiotica]QLH64045.1 acetolactate synthase 2 small subunit [Serratia symbiotica]
MMQHQLSIRAQSRPEMLERVLRVVRHRGFQVSSMHMVSALNTDNITIELTVTSQRPVSLLSSQLSKLMGVSCVEIQQ